MSKLCNDWHRFWNQFKEHPVPKPSPKPVPPVVPPVDPAAPTLASLDARVTALEHMDKMRLPLSGNPIGRPDMTKELK